MLLEYENKYPDDIENIIKLNCNIIKLQEQNDFINNKINQELLDKPKDWDLIQTEYNKYCDKFSPAYLSGSEWYSYISKFKTKELKQ